MIGPVAAVATVTKWTAPGLLAGLAVLVAGESTVIIALIAAVQSIVIGYLGLRQKRIEGSTRLIDQLQKQVAAEAVARSEDRELTDRLEATTHDLRRRLIDLEIGSARLVNQIEELGQRPVWTPKYLSKGTIT